MTDKPSAPVDAEDKLKAITWPTSAEDIGKGDAVGLVDLLTALQLLATDADRKAAATTTAWDGPTPGSMQVIKSGALDITRYWTKLVAASGGIAGALVTAAGIASPFITKVGQPVAVAFIGAGGLILAATAVALALFVRGDLEARGIATAARHRGRAEVAATFLQATGALPKAATATTSSEAAPSIEPPFLTTLVSVLAGAHTNIHVRCKGHTEFQTIHGFRHEGDTSEVLIGAKDWTSITEIDAFTSSD